MLGKLEEIVLLSLRKRGPEAMAAAVYETIADEIAKHIAFGAVFTTLDRLVDKGFVDCRVQPASMNTKNRPRKLYTISASGRKALDDSLVMTYNFSIKTGYVWGGA